MYEDFVKKILLGGVERETISIKCERGYNCDFANRCAVIEYYLLINYECSFDIIHL